METTVKQRIMELIAKEGISVREFERLCGLSNGYIKALRKSPTVDKMRSILDAFPNINERWLQSGEGSMYNIDVQEQDRQEGLPLITLDAMAGVLGGSDTTIMDYECDRYIVPAFHGADFLIRVQGDSMMPTYYPNDIVACQRVQMSRMWFQWGKAYVVDTIQGALLKRIQKSNEEGCVRLCSENEKYEPFDLPVSEINGVAIVRGLIRAE